MHSISGSEKIKIKIYVYTEPAHKWFLQFNTQLSKLRHKQDVLK